MEQRLQREIGEWIVSATLAGTLEVGIVAGVGERLNAAGVSMVRISVATDLLDPTFDGRGVRWLRDEGGVEETFVRNEEGTIVTVDFPQSPFGFLLRSGKPTMRRHLDATIGGASSRCSTGFRIMASPTTWPLRARRRIHSPRRNGRHRRVVDDRRAGRLHRRAGRAAHGLMPALTLAFMLRTTYRDTRTLLTTYLGRHAADRVLAGNIVRGRAEPIHAVVWFSDLVSFTRISDNISPVDLLALLNDYAEAQIGAIEAHGGHVLKFIGDGILAIFPDPDTTVACTRALDAAAKMRLRIAELNARRADSGLPVTDTHLALHAGELLYGNLGGPRRLDFTVLGRRSTRRRASKRCAPRSTRRSSCPGRSRRQRATRGAGS